MAPKAKSSVAKREQQAAEPAAPSMAPAMRQLVLLPVMWGSSKLNLDDPTNLLILQCVFGAVIGTAYLLLQFATFRAKRQNNITPVANPGTSQYLSDSDKAEDGSVTARAYDVAKLSESKLQLVMSAAITCFIHVKWQYTQPLLMISIMQPMQLWDNPAMHIHLRGKSGPGYERPWKGANADNPLAQWAEKKKAEAEEAKKK
eukprot:CAMPEP_0174728336 /NCGR_PEP_ID=MMETSP1094-20130205/51536_1 /TAXON_ID=156173 /ORGANISM="Chrysochromulina brevifilum, Strain UTEX LB 985" /LENGTH=201 /DNA_ID=CAMNT_0015930231 /DNA_START=7 /DNA_END=612 /DNA_ORIENTATION=+